MNHTSNPGALFHFPASANACLVDEAGTPFSYLVIREHVQRLAAELAKLPQPALLFLYASNSVESVVSYLACLQARVPLCLCEPQVSSFERLVAAYQPSGLFVPSDCEGAGQFRERCKILDRLRLLSCPSGRPFEHEIHSDLALLLTTSGSTGSPKLVRLSSDNLASNAESIARYLELNPEEKPIQSLPMQYSYGLSVLNSHLHAGATVVLTRHSFLRPEFWTQFREAECTSFAGVPYAYETLHRLGWDPGEQPTLRSFTQAGGALKRDLISHYCQKAADADQRFFVMYGQTEATARISFVPPERLAEKIGSIGVAIPGGALSLESIPSNPEVQQLVYEGRNVMLGYAEGPQDLGRGDDLHGVLRTGDLAERDADGYYFVKGRLSRFAKLFGKRVSLGDLEELVERRFGHHAVALDRGSKLEILVESPCPELRSIQTFLAETLALPPSALQIGNIESIPMTASGKIDYRAVGA